MQIKMEFTRGTGSMRTLTVPTGTLTIVRVPRMGLQGYHKPNGGRAQVFVPTGKCRTISECEAALISAWRKHVGLDEIRSFV